MTDLDTRWPAQEPTASFADRVVAAATRPHRRPRWPFAVGAGVLAAAAALLWVMTRTATSSTGEVRADHRIEVDIGSRAVAVLEPGAHIKWHGDDVVQDAGSAFYRVEHGARFVVHTPQADAVVLGTCFRISVNDKENAMSRRDFGAGLAGALAATGVLVGVYEGKVRVSHGQDLVTVAAGETATADATGVRLAEPTTAAKEGARTTLQLRARLAQVEQEKASLEHQLAAAHEAGGKSPYDLTADDWAKLAEQGAFKYQMPCTKDGGYRPTPAQLDKLGLGAADGDTIQAAYRHANEQLGNDLAAICGTNDEAAMGNCIGGAFRDLYKDGEDAARATYTQIDEIRAGKQPEPPVAQQSSTMRVLLLFSRGMNGFEADLAQTYGADEAHKIAYADDLCFQAQTF